MKIFYAIIGLIALALIGFNTTQLNFNTPFENKSMIAIITIIASVCVILMMAILWTSKRIETKVKERNKKN